MKPLLTTLLVLLLARSALAAPTGLNQIPTTDLQQPKQLQVTLQNGNQDFSNSPTFFQQPQPNLQFQYGLTKRIELGMDIVPAIQPADYRPQFNVKYDVLLEDYNSPAVAVGLATTGFGFQSSSYVVVTRTLNYAEMQYEKFKAHHKSDKLRGRRVHVGVMRLNGQWLPMAGTDIELGDHFVLYADYLGGSGNGAALGGVVVINQHSSVTASAFYANGAHHVNGAIMNYAYTFNF